ncbi:AGAP007395-PA-like protein [Anopheles sinensis]|uniref:AGAP007395-PA-like protein n=1 Tax=Anopheles sinensis TaxID=74873 RepID=A0A084WN36_ANOSI|nr:AGAP007395-PA-like protein [Anopheles sinensis]
MQDRLESFVDQLVEKNVGFLIEGALIINGHYNILSFVYFVPRKKRVYINSIILRQYALRGDLVKVFVMNKPEVSPADTNAVENYLGFVVAILEKRHDRTCIGSLLPQQDPFYCTLVPQDSTIPPVCIYKQFLTTQLIGNARSEENENGEHSKKVHSTETTILYQTKIIDWDGEIPIGSNLELVDKTINQKKYISHDKVPVFEQHVNYLLNNGKQPNKNFTRKSTRKFKPELTLPCIRDDSQKIVQSKLESFVDQMVEKNVGFLVERSIRVNVHNNKESYVDGSRRKKEGVCIGSIPLRQYAFHGDLVKVFVMNNPKVDDAKGSESVKRKNRPERRDRSYGFVVAILEKRHKRRCVGTLLPRQDSNYRILVPLDAKIPRLRIYMRNLPAELNEMESTGDAAMFYLADIIEWHDDVPIGANLKPLDQAGLLMNQNECILAEHNLDATPYADHILAQLPSVPYRIPQEEIDLREDLRGDCTFTIDSASARHLDDALSCKILENGNYEIGVHISDVTYFLREQSELDELAKLRATSIYMVDSVYRMLPEQLCDLCSLLPGQEKLTFSVFFEIFPDGTVINTRFARSVINSCAKLSYENAQIMINSAKGEGSSENVIQQIFHGYTVQSLSLILSQVHSIAVKLRQRRIEKGFLELDQSRLTFWIDTATGCPMEYDQNKLTTFDVLMVLANTSAAQAIQGALSSSALIRCPQPPSEKKIEDFVKTMAEHGYTISFANSQTVRESMDAIIAAAEHPDAATIVLNKLLAQFKNHQAPTLVYTNFTSPIRRYTDCMVHRVLAAKLGFGEESKRTLEELDELAKTCNMKRNRAKVAGDASLRFCYHQWLKTVQKHETVAAVVGYDAEHIELILLGTGISLKIMTKVRQI